MHERTVGDAVESSIRSDKRVEQLREELTADLLDAGQVAQILGLERSTVLRYLRDDELVGFQLGRRWVIPETEVRAFIERQAEARRQAARVAKGKAEAKRKVELWSETQPQRHWHLARCHKCGHEAVALCDQRIQRYDADAESWYWIIDRSGECEICETGIDDTRWDAQELMIEWALWRRDEIQPFIDAMVQRHRVGNTEYHRQTCDYCYSPVLVSGALAADADGDTWLQGKCQICDREVCVTREDQLAYENTPF